MRSHHLPTMFAATASVVALGAAPAVADPAKGLPVENVCDDGNTYTTVARGAATWNAQLDTDSNSAFHLTRYDITFTVTELDGTINVFGPEELVKGGNDRTHKELLSCTFSFDLTLGDGATAHVTGHSLGWLTPAGG